MIQLSTPSADQPSTCLGSCVGRAGGEVGRDARNLGQLAGTSEPRGPKRRRVWYWSRPRRLSVGGGQPSTVVGGGQAPPPPNPFKIQPTYNPHHNDHGEVDEIPLCWEAVGQRWRSVKEGWAGGGRGGLGGGCCCPCVLFARCCSPGIRPPDLGHAHKRDRILPQRPAHIQRPPTVLLRRGWRSVMCPSLTRQRPDSPGCPRRRRSCERYGSGSVVATELMPAPPQLTPHCHKTPS